MMAREVLTISLCRQQAGQDGGTRMMLPQATSSEFNPIGQMHADFFDDTILARRFLVGDAIWSASGVGSIPCAGAPAIRGARQTACGTLAARGGLPQWCKLRSLPR
jgi:hypothetical protein